MIKRPHAPVKRFLCKHKCNKFIDIQLHKRYNKEKNSAILVFTRKWKSDFRRMSNQNHESK